MNAKDLMIDDLVMFEGRICKVCGINAGGLVLLASYDKENNVDWCENHLAENIEPIPFTPEILENNGWVCCQFWHEWKKGEAIIQTALPNCRMKNGEKEFSTDKMQYFHELQHSLRLCGIEKEIVL